MSNTRSFLVAAMLVALCVTPAPAADLYFGVSSIARMRVHSGETMVGTLTQPPSTCSHFGEFLRFDHTTPNGKALLATLLTARAAEKPIEVWYSPSTRPGTNQDNGCDSSTAAVLTGVAIARDPVEVPAAAGSGTSSGTGADGSNRCPAGSRRCAQNQKCATPLTQEGCCRTDCVSRENGRTQRHPN